MKHWIGIFFVVVSTLWFSGCGERIDGPDRPKVDHSLPIVGSIKHLSDITEVAFEWQPVYDERVEGYNIYRIDPKATEPKRIAKIKDRYISHYVDTGLKPATQYGYRFVVFDKEERESASSELINAKTTPMLESVSYIKALMGLPGRVKVLWRPHPDARVKEYIIERNTANSTSWSKMGSVDGRLNAEYIDNDLKPNMIYKYRVRVKTFDGMESEPSEIVEAKTKPLPKIVKGVKASTQIPRKIKIEWIANSERDISHYNVYRSSSPHLFFSYLAKTKANFFDDILDEDGEARYYRVTAVDTDGLESLVQDNPIMGTTLAKPATPQIESAAVQGRNAVLAWSSVDERTVGYVVLKHSSKGTFSTQTQRFANIRGETFTDRNLTPGVEYAYQIMSVDTNGVESKPTKKFVLVVPKTAGAAASSEDAEEAVSQQPAVQHSVTIPSAPVVDETIEMMEPNEVIVE